MTQEYKYTHTNHNSSVLNVKLLQIERFKFDTSKFMQQNLMIIGSDTLNDTLATPCPRVSCSAAVNAYGTS
jgi:hypothetical protein